MTIEKGKYGQSKQQHKKKKRVIPSRKKVSGVVTMPTTFGANLPFKTPTKMTLSVAKGTAGPEVTDMIKNCLGMPLKTFPNVLMKCKYCNKHKTPWYCVRCKRWLCMEKRDITYKDDNGNEIERNIPVYSHPIKGKVYTFSYCCFHKAHEQNWKDEKENMDFAKRICE